LAVLLVYGWIGECDRRDAESYARIRAEILASASEWAAR